VPGRLARLIATALLVGACSGPTASASPGSSALPAVLTIESRGGPAIQVLAGSTVLAEVACGQSLSVAPGGTDVPALPWNLVVRTKGDRTILVTGTVTALPEWLVLVGSDATLRSGPVDEPSAPPCPS
jgi:hypothetical protein